MKNKPLVIWMEANPPQQTTDPSEDERQMAKVGSEDT